MSEPVFTFRGDDPQMNQAYQAARRTFKFFWRELYWERRRIVPGLDAAMIKLRFTDGPRSDGKPEYEQMWVNEVDFDGQILTGRLINAPNWLKSVKQGDSVRTPVTHFADWMMVADGIAYGGYTVDLMRSRMNPKERKAHDRAWGLNFGEPNNVRIEIIREEKTGGILSRLFSGKSQNPPRAASPEKFHDHPMCVNMLPEIESQIQQDRSLVNATDERGWMLLHSEALAGNLGIVRLLVRHGAKTDARTPDGRNAAALAKSIGWQEVSSYLSNDAKAEQRNAR